MTQVNYRSTRLLIEAINQEMDVVRKAAMGNMALGSLNELRDLVAQLTKKAERLALEDLAGMADTDPAEYVAAMMPFVAEYHRQLAPRDLLAPCLCRDLRVPACVVIVVGDEGSRVRAAHDPDRPDAALIVETLLAALDAGTKQVAADAAAVKQRLYDAAAEQSRGEVGIDQELSMQRSETLDDADKKPCAPFPEDGVEAKSISLDCPRCGTWRCWRRYLSWEKALGVTLNQDLHPAEVDDDHKGLRFGDEGVLEGPEMGDEDGWG